VSIDSEGVLREALALPNRDRAALAAELLASLDELSPDDEEAVRIEWADELDRRARRARSGDDQGTLWPDVRDRLRNQLAR
jgi:hypothetical protein